MGRALFAVGALLAVCFVGFGLVVYLTREEDGVAVNNLLSESLTREVALTERRGETTVDFAGLTAFRWERLCITDARTPRDVISEGIGFEFTGEVNLLTGVLLIFIRDGRLERFADYRGEGRFEGIERPVACFDREDAEFRVRDLVLTPSGGS